MAQPSRGVVGIARTLKLLVLAAALVCLGCGTLPPTTATAPAEPPTRLAQPPEWRPGDRWVYRAMNGTADATRTIEVLETREVSGTRYYVLKTQDEDLLNFWTLDLHWAFAVGERDSKVAARVDHPIPWFTWPLEVGRRWTHQTVYEDRSGRRQANETFLVVGMEAVDVPAGRFNAMKIVREGQSADSDQYWYVPEVRSYARWILKRGDRRVDESLVEYKPAERLIPAPTGPTSKPR